MVVVGFVVVLVFLTLLEVVWLWMNYRSLDCLKVKTSGWVVFTTSPSQHTAGMDSKLGPRAPSFTHLTLVPLFSSSVFTTTKKRVCYRA